MIQFITIRINIIRDKTRGISLRGDIIRSFIYGSWCRYGKDQLACISWSFCICISCESFNWFSKPFNVFSNSETLAVASWSLAVKEFKLESVAVSPFMRSLSSADLASSVLSNCFVPLRSCCNEEFLAWDLFSSSFTSDSLFESAFSASF